MSNNLIDLIILRHGEAAHGAIDQERSLTSYGQQQITSQYRWLAGNDFQPELIIHSPYRRTTETAYLAKPFFPDSCYEIEPLITPDGDPQLAASMIPALGKRRLIVASHMPMVSYLTASLVTGLDRFGFPVAGLCWIQIDKEALTSKLLHRHWPTV